MCADNRITITDYCSAVLPSSAGPCGPQFIKTVNAINILIVFISKVSFFHISSLIVK